MLKNKTTLQIAAMVAEDAADENLKNRYGTSIEENMSRDHAKDVRKKLNELRNEFKLINKDKNSEISIEELTQFLNKRNPNNFTIDSNHMQKIFKFLEITPDDKITVDGFVQCYAMKVEKLKTKNTKIEKILDELVEEKNRHKKKLESVNSEKEYENGLTENSRLYITVVEAELKKTGILNLIDSYVSLTFQGETQKTLIKKNTYIPAWNENFSFKVKNLDACLIVEVFDNSLFMNRSLGSFKIFLKNFKNQEKQISWIDLHDGNSTTGKIRIKLQLILSFIKYFKEQIDKTEKRIEFLNSVYNITRYFVENDDVAFGVIYCENLDLLLNNETFKQTDALIEMIESEKANLFVRRSYMPQGGQGEECNCCTF